MFLYSDVLQCHHIRQYQAAEACAGVCVCHSSSPGKFDPNHPVSEPPDWRLRGLCDRGWHRCLSSESLFLVCLSEQLLLWQHEFWVSRGYQDLFIFLFSLFYNLPTASSIFRIYFLLEEEKSSRIHLEQFHSSFSLSPCHLFASSLSSDMLLCYNLSNQSSGLKQFLKMSFTLQ